MNGYAITSLRKSVYDQWTFCTLFACLQWKTFVLICGKVSYLFFFKFKNAHQHKCRQIVFSVFAPNIIIKLKEAKVLRKQILHWGKADFDLLKLCIDEK